MTIPYHRPTRFRVEQPGTLPLEFDGWLLGEASSENSPRRRRSDRAKVTPRRPADRWTEVRIYLTTLDNWVVEYLGCSREPGETTLRRVEVVSDPLDVLEAVRHAGSQKVPGVSAKALRAAAALDDRLEAALVDRV